jgi:LysR family transcriptional regulator, glycine cleavage system transcriptional activator
MNSIHMRRFRNIPPLQYLLGFEAAARHQSFSKAAVELGLSQSAISHEMRLLEQRVGQPLFIRHGRSIRLTDAGHDYQRTVTRSLEQLEAGYRQLEPYRKPGSVVIYAPQNFAARWLLPRLNALKKAVPSCDPWIDTSGTKIDFDEMEVSIAILKAREVDPKLISKCLFADELVPVASPNLIKRPLKNPNEILKYQLIHDERTEGWSEWFESIGIAAAEVSTGLDFSDSDLAMQGAEQGLGIALACVPLIQDFLKAKRLIRLSSRFLSTGESWFAVSTQKELANPVTLSTWNWLTGDIGV